MQNFSIFNKSSILVAAFAFVANLVNSAGWEVGPSVFLGLNQNQGDIQTGGDPTAPDFDNSFDGFGFGIGATTQYTVGRYGFTTGLHYSQRSYNYEASGSADPGTGFPIAFDTEMSMTLSSIEIPVAGFRNFQINSRDSVQVGAGIINYFGVGDIEMEMEASAFGQSNSESADVSYKDARIKRYAMAAQLFVAGSFRRGKVNFVPSFRLQYGLTDRAKSGSLVDEARTLSADIQLTALF